MGRFNLVCERSAETKPRLIFYGHVDVVPAAGWDAFRGRVSDGRLYGRGAADMKGGIVGLLGGLEAVSDKPVNYDIGVVITTDEEMSQASQLRYLARFLEPVKDASVFCLDSSFGFVDCFAAFAGGRVPELVEVLEDEIAKSEQRHRAFLDRRRPPRPRRPRSLRTGLSWTSCEPN